MPFLDASGRFGDTTIDLSTRSGKPIENTQVWEYSRLDWQVLGETLKRFSRAERVSDACPVYNCHGLTLGSRRTQVTNVILPILDEDGYELLGSEKEVRTGDMVVYCSERGEVIHSGFIVWRHSIQIVPGTDTIIPMVWSKWGKGCEMLHAAENCPYLEDAGDFLRYYRLKRWQPPVTATADPTVLNIR